MYRRPPTSGAPARCADVPESERDMEPRTIVRQPIGEGEQLGPGGIRRHHPGAIVNRSPVRMERDRNTLSCELYQSIVGTVTQSAPRRVTV
jgi:hypothetical protein